MINKIAYRYIRNSCQKILMLFVALLLILLIFPFLTSSSWTWLLEPANLATLAVPLLGIFYCVLMIVRPDLHQVFWRLKKYGSAQSIAAQIDQDAKSYSEAVNLSKAGYTATFTPSWIVWSRGVFATQVRIVNFADIVQIYQHTVSVNGFEQYNLAIRTKDGKKTNMNFYRNEELITVIMNRIQQTTPSVKIGYDGWF